MSAEKEYASPCEPQGCRLFPDAAAVSSLQVGAPFPRLQGPNGLGLFLVDVRELLHRLDV